jgi:hypothetical protein
MIAVESFRGRRRCLFVAWSSRRRGFATRFLCRQSSLFFLLLLLFIGKQGFYLVPASLLVRLVARITSSGGGCRNRRLGHRDRSGFEISCGRRRRVHMRTVAPLLGTSSNDLLSSSMTQHRFEFARCQVKSQGLPYQQKRLVLQSCRWRVLSSKTSRSVFCEQLMGCGPSTETGRVSLLKLFERSPMDQSHE